MFQTFGRPASALLALRFGTAWTSPPSASGLRGLSVGPRFFQTCKMSTAQSPTTKDYGLIHTQFPVSILNLSVTLEGSLLFEIIKLNAN